jgi:trafficking protein particle complex subunit 8
MTSSPLSTNSLSSALPSFRSASPLPQILRSAAASSTSSLSSLFQFSPTDSDVISIPSDELRAHQATISQAFGPTVAVIASRECEEMLREKGHSGLFDLLRPFGDCIPGKVNIRDSQAMTISLDDFSVKFIDFHHYAENIPNGRENHDQGPYAPKRNAPSYIPGGDLVAIERLMEYHVESINQNLEQGSQNGDLKGSEYSFFLRRMLSAVPVSAHETFSHPVACVLAVSSRHQEPIDALLGLYNTTNNAPIPRFIDAGFLRYYVLIHDEDKDDIDKYGLERMVLIIDLMLFWRR